MSSTATYLYAITRPLEDERLADLSGVAGAAVRAVTEAGTSCLVSTVDLDTFGEQALRANLEDLEWLQRVAYEHDAVVRAAAALTTTAPLRLATVCADDDAVRARLRALGEPARDLLARLDDRQEWGVKLLAVGREEAPQPVAVQSGTAYLQQRKAALSMRAQSATAELRRADDVYARLLDSAIAGHRHRPQDERLSGLGRPMLLNAAYLVDNDAVEEFRRTVDQIARTLPADTLLLTGPWPPYSFASLEVS